MEIGATVGNYRITALLGEGGMGQVFVAEHPLIGKKVALKVLRAELARDPEAVARFFTEARAVVRVGHENIVDISDFGRTGAGECYFIMELLAGQPLATRLEKGRLPWRDAFHVAIQVSSALEAAHAQHILHRDLKPDNIFLVHREADPSFVKVLDFGLAKLSDDAGQSVKTKSGMIMGTPYYMSPEQAEGAADIDARTDVYALGVILYQCLTGQVPFTGQTFAQILVKHMTVEAVPPRQLVPDLPAEVEAIVLRAIAKSRDQRYQSMTEMRGAMRALLDGTAGRSGRSEPRLALGDPGAFSETTPVPVPSPVPTSRPPSARGASDRRPASGMVEASPGSPPAHVSTLGAAAVASVRMSPSATWSRRKGVLAGVAAGSVAVIAVVALAIAHGSRKAPPAAVPAAQAAPAGVVPAEHSEPPPVAEAPAPAPIRPAVTRPVTPVIPVTHPAAHTPTHHGPTLAVNAPRTSSDRTHPHSVLRAPVGGSTKTKPPASSSQDPKDGLVTPSF